MSETWVEVDRYFSEALALQCAARRIVKGDGAR
jgi:hypothetical protein